MIRWRELKALLGWTASLLRHEGMGSLLRHAFSFMRLLVSRIFLNLEVFLYEHSLAPRERNQFLPRLDSWELRIIASNAEADAVAAEGLEDLRRSHIFASRSLEQGAVAFCVYVGDELAHVGWLAVDERGKARIDTIPYPVAFEAGQACTGGTFTKPAFRGKGLMPYGYYERFEYLRAHGFTSSRNAVVINNTPSQKAHSRFDPLIYGVGRYRKLLWWRSWHVTELPGGPRRGMPPPASEIHM